ncbi:CCR4-NOT core subunit NOT3 NDAI_0A02690 [Naumovozyma dairenensis CBS 421]|uniref:CCR4-Not complex component Not N-terminal domain-containing protein n=1 Tax=Naumovozyma dairenensis (strain ATCC 10597 / BCRC 20456 / CBS 421 / NBRC 0211 / NRRL Y-12639) TaxID=1071378 RepID=G0W3N9_NAUDC|nr:hypothetical protein NDAI_0A02690 [Naumovozyma dairenensis CBS 421]CCD22427.1 hypothetical protein NDAI_0A02690 [Naumovozyma dairenensis CBS 421]
MAHRKLQQEVDRVFKKINEGLEVFNTYYERHEACTNNPSQKDKLESDLKREVKKLQRLRDQVKSWQSSPEIKDKDSLLDFRRSVEIAMEKYKAVEKASKEKAYSNISLKKSEILDPEEQERKDVSDYLSSMIDELERQYESLQVEVDKLTLLNKKKKTASSLNDEKKEQLKAVQARYRWHQQQMELALRLLANEELDPQAVNDVKDDINYFVESNQDPDFMEDETIYDSLDLQSNEAIAHEVAQYFASQSREDEEDEEEDDKETSKLSKKEQRKLEREAKKAAKLASKNGPEKPTVPISAIGKSEDSIISPMAPSTAKSATPSPILKKASTDTTSLKSIPTSASVPNTAKSPNATSQLKSSTTTTTTTTTTTANFSNIVPESQGAHTHIRQGQNGITSSTILKPATVPAKPAGELKWSVAATLGLEKDKKLVTSATSSKPASTTATPRSVTPSLVLNNHQQQQHEGQQVNLDNSSSASSPTAVTAAAVLAAGAAAVNQNNQAFHRNQSILHQTNDLPSLSTIEGRTLTEEKVPTKIKEEVATGTVDDNIIQDEDETEISTPDVFDDEAYEALVSDDDLEDQEPQSKKLTDEEIKQRTTNHDTLINSYLKDFGTLLLPSGIQEFIIESKIHQNRLDPNDGKLGGYRRSVDLCEINRLDNVPKGVNPPTPLDAFRSTQQWDIIRCSLRDILDSFDAEKDNYDNSQLYNEILEKFRGLEMFTLFYNYYFAVTPLEKEIANVILNERNWKVSFDETMWFLRQGPIKFQNELCELGDYKIFKLDEWLVVDKINFKLDYSSLKIQTPSTITIEKLLVKMERSSSSSTKIQVQFPLLLKENRIYLMGNSFFNN